MSCQLEVSVAICTKAVLHNVHRYTAVSHFIRCKGLSLHCPFNTTHLLRLLLLLLLSLQLSESEQSDIQEQATKKKRPSQKETNTEVWKYPGEEPCFKAGHRPPPPKSPNPPSNSPLSRRQPKKMMCYLYQSSNALHVLHRDSAMALSSYHKVHDIM